MALRGKSTRQRGQHGKDLAWGVCVEHWGRGWESGGLG